MGPGPAKPKMISASISFPRDQRRCLAQEVIRLAGEHARNDIGTVMLWTSAIVVLLSSGVD